MRAASLIAFAPLLAVTLLAGCKSAPTVAPEARPQAGRTAEPVDISAKNNLLDFEYGWPAQAASIPQLDQWLRGDSVRVRAQAMDEARRDEQGKAGHFNPHSYVELWTTVADIPALLVLQANGYAYTGGAHGLPFVATLIWDKAARKRLAIDALIYPSALAMAMHDRFCRALDLERMRKRSELTGVRATQPPPVFSRCVDMTRQEILPISIGGKAIDAIRTVIMPGEAGPYVEGSYTIDLPINDAALAAVTPAYRADFAKP